MLQLTFLRFTYTRFAPVLLLMIITGVGASQAGDFLISRHEKVKTIQICEDIILPAYRALGINPRVVELPGRRALFAANSGKTDAELCRISHISLKYSNLIKIEPALTEFSIVALSIRPLPKIKSKADLTGYNLGSQRGMKAAEDYFQEHKIIYANTANQVIQLLDDGLIDYAILSLRAVKRFQQDKHRQDFTIHHPPLFQHKLYHYIHKRHQQLAPALSLEISRTKHQEQ